MLCLMQSENSCLGLKRASLQSAHTRLSWKSILLSSERQGALLVLAWTNTTCSFTGNIRFGLYRRNDDSAFKFMQNRNKVAGYLAYRGDLCLFQPPGILHCRSPIPGLVRTQASLVLTDRPQRMEIHQKLLPLHLLLAGGPKQVCTG